MGSELWPGVFVCNAWHCDCVVWICAFWRFGILSLGTPFAVPSLVPYFHHRKTELPVTFPMSRRRSTSSAMGPPPDRDTPMGPPPVPVPSGPQKGMDGQDISEKYRKLKRRFFELEEVSANLNLFLQQERKS